MINSLLVHYIESYGYPVFFLAFSLGPFGIPIPNEVTLLTGAILSSTGALNPYLTYSIILAGLWTAVTLGYWGGRLFGQQIGERFRHNRHFQKAEAIFNRFGEKAICLAFFLPVIRYLIPLFAGISGTTFRRFALLSYSSALFWTAAFFIVGHFLGGLTF